MTVPRKSIPHLALLFVLLARTATSVFCHPAPFSYLDVHLKSDAIEATFIAHTLDLAHELKLPNADDLLNPSIAATQRTALENWLRSRFTLLTDQRLSHFTLTNIEPLPDRQALSLQLRWNVTSLPGQMRMQGIFFPYDPQHQTFLNLYESEKLVRQEIISVKHSAIEHFTNSRQGQRAALKSAFTNGLFHAFTDLKLILLLIGLFVLGGSFHRLLSIAAAFLFTSSLTCTLVLAKTYAPASRVIAVTLALSMIYLGIDNLMVGKSGRDLRLWIALVIGLICGLHFALLLRESTTGIVATTWTNATMSFGLLLGQVSLAASIAAFRHHLNAFFPSAQNRLIALASASLIVSGGFAFVQQIVLKS